MADLTDEDFEFELELAKAKAKAAKAKAAAPAPGPVELTPEERAQFATIGQPSPSETRLGRIASFMSGSPLFGTVTRAAGAVGVGGGAGQLQRSAQQATEQFSPKVAGVPVLPVLGGVVATAPAGAARIGGTLGGAALNTARASRLARIGLQGGIGGVTAADRGGDVGDVAAGTGLGLVAGAAGEGAGEVLTRGAQALRPAAERFANSQAIKALLGGGTMVNRLKTQLGITDDAGLQALGRDVRGLGVLGTGPIPASASGINENVIGRMAGAGDEIGRIRELADTLVQSGKASPPDALKIAQAYEAGVRGAADIADKAAVAPEVAARSQRFLEQAVSARIDPSAVVPTKVGTYGGMWDQSSAMQRSAFSSMDPPASRAARTALERAGVMEARGELGRQMEAVVGPDEARNLAEAMKTYATTARIKDVVEDTASRAAARNAIGLTDQNFGQMVGQSIPGAALPVSALSSLVRGRANAAGALWAPPLARAAAPAVALTGAAARFGAPAVARQAQTQSISDPLGPLRQYLQLTEEEQKAASVDAFRGGP